MIFFCRIKILKIDFSDFFHKPMEQLLEEIYSDISFNQEDLDILKNNTNNYINEELKKVNIYLTKSVKEFCKDEIEKMKQKKIDRFNNNINSITEKSVRLVAKRYDLDEDDVVELNKDNMLEVNDFHTLYQQTYTDEFEEEPENTVEENINDVFCKSAENLNMTLENKTSKKKLDKTTENNDYKEYLISQNKCPAFIKGKYCEKEPKHGHYCGYHKKFHIS